MGKIGRNDPCSCGSGRKHKLCCGALARVAAPPPAPPPASLAPPALQGVLPTASAERSCGECTRCCDGWVAGEIRGHLMQPGTACHFLAAGSCSIYEERPQSPCRNFVCGWLMADSPLPESFRPDKVGVMAVPIRWRSAPAFILVSAGNDPGDELLDWMRDFANRTRVPFFYERAGERFGYGPPEFQREMAAKVERGERLW